MQHFRNLFEWSSQCQWNSCLQISPSLGLKIWQRITINKSQKVVFHSYLRSKIYSRVAIKLKWVFYLLEGLLKYVFYISQKWLNIQAFLQLLVVKRLCYLFVNHGFTWFLSHMRDINNNWKRTTKIVKLSWVFKV